MEMVKKMKKKFLESTGDFLLPLKYLKFGPICFGFMTFFGSNEDLQLWKQCVCMCVCVCVCVRVKW